jgi:hypothetical protein
MSALPKPRPQQSEPAAPASGGADSLASSLSDALAQASSTAPGAPPPHLLWATLESAYSEQSATTMPEEERLPPHIALPLAVGLSLILWGVIVGLVLIR